MFEWVIRLRRRIERLPGVLHVVNRLRVLRLVWKQAVKDRCLEMAGSLGFQTVFSLIPGLALAVLMFPSLGQGAVQTVNSALGFDKIRLSTGAPATAPTATQSQPTTTRPEDGEPDEPEGVQLSTWIEDRLGSVQEKLSGPGLPLVSIIVLVFTATSLMLTLENSIGAIYGVTKSRSIALRVLIYWGVLTLSPLALAAAAQGNALLTGNLLHWSPGLLGWVQKSIVPWIGSSFALWMIYFLMPNVRVSFRASVVAALVTGLFFEISKYLFGLYVKNAVSYGELYGTLGLIPLFLFWVWLIYTMVLVGAELCYAIQHRKTLRLEEHIERHGRFARVDELAIAVVGVICHQFQHGEQPVTQPELLELSIMEQRDLVRLTEALQKAGIIRTIDGDPPSYVPARPPEGIAVADVVDCIERHLLGSSVPAPLSKSTGLNQLLNAMASARRQVVSEISFRDLSEESESPPTSSEPEPPAEKPES